MYFVAWATVIWPLSDVFLHSLQGQSSLTTGKLWEVPLKYMYQSDMWLLASPCVLWPFWRTCFLQHWKPISVASHDTLHTLIMCLAVSDTEKKNRCFFFFCLFFVSFVTYLCEHGMWKQFPLQSSVSAELSREILKLQGESNKPWSLHLFGNILQICATWSGFWCPSTVLERFPGRIMKCVISPAVRFSSKS